MVLGTGYRPGCGPEPALKSVRRRLPAACSTLPRPSCSLAGSWPVGQHWWYDLDDKEQTELKKGEGMGGLFSGLQAPVFPLWTAAAIWCCRGACYMKCCGPPVASLCHFYRTPIQLPTQQNKCSHSGKRQCSVALRSGQVVVGVKQALGTWNAS